VAWPDPQSFANFAQTLVRAGAVRPAVGLFAILISLSTIDTLKTLPQWEGIFWLPFLIASVLGFSGTYAVTIFLLRRDQG